MSTPTASEQAEKPAEKGQALVIYDGGCPFCQKSVAVLRRLDWLGRLQYFDARDVEHLPACEPPLEPARLMEEMHLLTPDRCHVYAGFKAFRWMAWRLPPLWPVAPFLYLPGVPALGQRVYLWIARHRYQIVPCRDGVCEVPRPGSRVQSPESKVQGWRV